MIEFYILGGDARDARSYEGPYSFEDAWRMLTSLCGAWASPEAINRYMMTKRVDDGAMQLVKDDNDNVLDGKGLAHGTTYWVDGKILEV